jgi:hypothetical protein
VLDNVAYARAHNTEHQCNLLQVSLAGQPCEQFVFFKRQVLWCAGLLYMFLF